MSTVREIVPIRDRRGFLCATMDDLIELVPIPGGIPQIVSKERALVIHDAIVDGDRLHVSGPTGSGKTAQISALLSDHNFWLLCKYRGIEYRPLFNLVVEACSIAEASEWWIERGIDEDGKTFARPGELIRFFVEAETRQTTHYPVFWIAELGRVHASVANGLLDVLNKGPVHLPNGGRVNTSGVAGIVDSNYQHLGSASYVLSTRDEALFRRMDMNLTVPYPSPEEEIRILHHLCTRTGVAIERQRIEEIVLLGKLIREHKAQGRLGSAISPNIGAYLVFARKLGRFPELAPEEVARFTLLGNVTSDDQELIPGLINQVWGVGTSDDEELDAELEEI